MIKVLRHGNRINVINPVTGQPTEMVNVIFVEEGRSGANPQLSITTDFLSSLVGEDVGLQNLRVHTQPVLVNQLEKFPIGKEFPGHINRGLFSTPQMQQQENRPARMIGGKPTYFSTWIDGVAAEDVDQRVSNEILLRTDPDAFRKANVGATRVEILEDNGLSTGRASIPERVNLDKPSAVAAASEEGTNNPR